MIVDERVIKYLLICPHQYHDASGFHAFADPSAKHLAGK